MKKQYRLYVVVVSQEDDSTRKFTMIFRVFLRVLLACWFAILDSVFKESIQTGHLHQSGQSAHFSGVELATLTCRQVTSRDYNLLPRGILGRIRPGNFSRVI